VTALEPILAGGQGPKLQGTWQRVGARLAIYLVLKPVHGDTQSAGYRQIELYNHARVRADKCRISEK
jgi:hypothetical protein